MDSQTTSTAPPGGYVSTYVPVKPTDPTQDQTVNQAQFRLTQDGRVISQDPTALAFDPTDTIAQLENAFPWLQKIGLSVQWLHDTAVDVAGNADLFVQTLRQTPQYQSRFPAIRRTDGSLRMTEAQYIQMEDDYWSLLKQYGVVSQNQPRRPQDLAPLFESEQDTEELKQRLQVYQAVRDAGQPTKDAFYVYAGMNLSTDQLFNAIIDNKLGEQLQADYIAATSQGIDYQTFIGRSANVALERLAQSGVSVPANATPENVSQILDVLYQNGDGQSQPLALEELLSAFEASQIGAAATNVGLQLPTKDRVNEFRAAGVQQAQAKDSYLKYALQGGSLSADAQRAGFGPIDQTTFENAAFLGQADATRAIQTATAYESAVGKAGGGFRFQQSQQGDITQSGLR